MPRDAAKPEPMDMHEIVAEQEIAIEPVMAEEYEEEAEQETEAKDQPNEAEYEEMVTIRASDLLAMQDTLDDMRFKIANIERDARQAQFEAEERLRHNNPCCEPS
jgi:hypothetical protein